MPEDLAALLKTIPTGWKVNIDWHQDDYPCVEVTLSKDFGRDKHVGHGHGEDLAAALAAAVREAVALVKQKIPA